MLHWKNKPIDQLSEKELKKALTQSVGMMLTSKNTDQNDDTFSILLFGIIIGGLVAIAGIWFSSMV